MKTRRSAQGGYSWKPEQLLVAKAGGFGLACGMLNPFIMKRYSCVLAALLISTAFIKAAEPTKSALESDAQGWVDIMPSTDLKGWYRVSVPPNGKLGREQWHVEKNLLVCDGDGGHDMLLLDKEIGDAIFHFEFCYTKIDTNPAPKYNSGAYVRNSKDGDVWHQAQFGGGKDGFLFGSTPTADGKKKFFNTSKAIGATRVKPAGEWNTLEVTAKGKVLTLWVNGAVTCSFDACGMEKGRLGLEGEGYRIEFRNLKLKELGQ